jgi:DNA-binding GntR family transcriptional regulator
VTPASPPVLRGPGADAGASLAGEAFARLKRGITRCEIPPGARLTEAGLMRRLGLGKTPIREALVRLVHEGLVRAIPRHGYEVAPITLADVEDLFRLRRVLEPAATELAAGRIDPATERRLTALSRVESCVPGDLRSVAAYRRATHEFHVLVARAAGSRRLAEAVERLEDESDRLFILGLMQPERRRAVRLGHQGLLAALLAGDGAAARRQALEGIVHAERVIRDALGAQPGVRAATVLRPAASPGR